jgi:hypothetical protein
MSSSAKIFIAVMMELRRRAAEQRDELAPLHVWMAPAWQEKM